MASKDRRERERSELRTRIMDAARRMIVQQGCEALSMRKLAEAIEYSPTAIYDYFKDKDALIQEICRTDFARLASMSREASAIEDPIERIRQMTKDVRQRTRRLVHDDRIVRKQCGQRGHEKCGRDRHAVSLGLRGLA